MSKRQIEKALRAKGLECAVLEYNWQPTPGGMVPGWDLELSETSQDKIASLAPDFYEWEPDCSTAAEVLEWIETIPDVRA